MNCVNQRYQRYFPKQGVERVSIVIFLLSSNLTLAQTVPPSPPFPSSPELQLVENIVYNRILRDAQELHLLRQRQLEWQVWAFGTVITLIAGVGVVLGYARVRDISNTINENLGPIAAAAAKSEFRAIQEQIDAARREIDEAAAEQTLATRFFDFKILARDIAQASSFTHQNEQQALKYVEQFRDRIREGDLPEALPVLRELSSSLFQAGRWEQLQKLEEWFREIVHNDRYLRSNLIEAYVYQSFHHHPNTYDFERARVVFRAAWDAKYGETALAGELLLLATTSQNDIVFSEDLRRYLARAKDFDQREMLVFLSTFGRYMNAELLAKQPMVVHREIERAASSIFDAGFVSFRELASRVDHTLAQMAGAEGFAHLLQVIEQRSADAITH